jgi:hypothetical protein
LVCITANYASFLINSQTLLNSFLEGIWVELDEQGLDRAGSANLFTSTQGTRPGMACIMHGVGVEVAPVPGSS